LSVAIKTDADVFRDLYTIDYKRIGNNIIVKGAGVSNAFLYDGDCYISNLNVTDYTWTYDNIGDQPIVGSDFVSIILESDFNVGLRHEDSVDTPGKYTYYQFSNDVAGDNAQALADYISTKYYRPTDSTFYFYPEAYLYNKGYTNSNSLSRYINISPDYDFCSDCLETFPYRIYYSESDDIERRKDQFLIIRPNNYTDIDGNSGPITDMFTNFNELVITTPYTPYIIPTNVQVLNTTDSTNVYIGSGKVFQIPPKPLKNSDIAFAGNEFWKSRCSTEYGNLWVDTKSKRVLLLNDKLNDISLTGLRNFWQENGSIQFIDQFKLLTGTDYPVKNLVHNYGVGVTSVYDSRHKRAIIHKRDYKITDFYATNFVATQGSIVDTPGTLWFNGTNFFYNKYEFEVGPDTILVNFNNSTFFENKSFTISYSFLSNSWISYHSYFPYYLYSDANSFYSDNCYKHNEGNFQTYYGTKYNHILDFIAINHPVESKITTNICYTATASNETSGVFNPVNATFNKLIAYNSRQSSGYQDVVIKSPFELNIDNNQVRAVNVDNKWRINDLRDITIDSAQPVWSKNWNDISSSYWIDRVPNNIDYLKSPYETSRLRDHYLGLRLFFNPSFNYKINTDIVQTYNANRNR